MTTATSDPSGKPKLKILLVCFEENSDTETRRRLAAAGHVVTEVACGGDAARILRSRPANLILVAKPRDSTKLVDVVANLRGDSCRISARYTPIFLLADEDVSQSLPAAYVDRVLPLPLDCNALVAAYSGFLSDLLTGAKRDTEPKSCEIDAAIDRLGGDVELYKDLVSRFLEDSAGTRRQLEQAVEQGDAPSLHRAAHGLKGLAASIGATAVAGVLAELEEVGRAQEAHRISDVWQRFQSEMATCADELAPYYQQARFSSVPLN